MTSTSAKVYLVDANVGLASFGNVQMSTFSGTLQTEHVPVMRRIRTDLANASPQGVVTLCVIMADCHIPGPEARKAVGDLLEQITGSERAAAYVIEIKGIGGSAMRTMLSTLVMAARGKHPSKVFEHTADAVAWVVEQCAKISVDVSGSALNAASEELRHLVVARHQGPPPPPPPAPETTRRPPTPVR